MKTLILFIFCFVFLACSIKEEKNEQRTFQNFEKNHDSLNLKLSTIIDTAIRNINLKISLNDTLVIIDYRLHEIERKIQIKYNNFTEVLIPNKSVAIVHKNDVLTNNFYLSNENLMILPLIGINNNLLQVFIINLESEAVFNYDIRTYSEFLWINELKNHLNMVTTSQIIEDSNSNSYFTINKYKITKSEILLLKSKEIKLKDSTRISTKKIIKFLN